MKDSRLKQQLRAQAVSPQEADDLAALARGLRQMPLPHLGQDAKDDIAERLGLRPKRYRIQLRLTAVTSFAVLALLVIAVQTSVPGSRLYAIKHAVNKLMPWSQRLQAPTEPSQQSMPLDDQSAPSPLPTRSDSPGDDKSNTPTLQGGNSVEPSTTDTLQSLPLSLQLQGPDGGDSKNLTDEVHDILNQLPITQPILRKIL